MIVLPQTAPPVSGRSHMRFLDGIRGLSALTVVLGHICGGFGSPRPVSFSTAFFFILHQVSHLAHVAVCVFIVLSGFCLMLPVVKAQDRHLAGGIKGFVQRRAWRILPPYYAALAFTFALPVLHSFALILLKKSSTLSWAGLSIGNVVSHLLLIQNFRTSWAFAWDGPTWSVSTEWQIYFLFAFLLLPIWRRLGIAACLVAATIIGCLPHFLLPIQQNFDLVCPWLLSLFAFGMLGAIVAISPDKYWENIRRKVRWPIITVVSTICILPIYLLLSDKTIVAWGWLIDNLAALPIVYLILWCSSKSTHTSIRESTLIGVLESRMAQALGMFSYSLYLVHLPIIEQIDSFTFIHLARFPVVNLAFKLLISLPIAIGGAYLFYLGFERPFLKIKKSLNTKASPIGRKI